MNKKNLNENLKKLSNIADWFEQSKDLDIEEGLKKAKEAASIIKESKERLVEIENEFEEIKKEIQNQEK
jgi:hypothetical protein